MFSSADQRSLLEQNIKCFIVQLEASSKQTSKTVYSCLVVGPRDAGKTTFCQVKHSDSELLPRIDFVQRFLGRGHEATAEIPASELPRATVNSVTVYGQPKYLVLLDTDITTAADGLTPLQVGFHLDTKPKQIVLLVQLPSSTGIVLPQWKS